MSGPVNGDASTSAQMPTMVFLNKSSQSVPAFGCMRITGTDTAPSGQTCLTVDQPNGNDSAYAFNGPVSVAANSYGNCYLIRPCPALYDDAAAAPGVNASVGPVSGSWKLSTNTAGFRTIGAANTTQKTSPIVDYVSTLVKEGYLYTDLAKAPRGGSSSASMHVYSGSGASWVDSGQVLTVINRDDTFFANSGMYIMAVYLNGEWRVIPTVAPEDMLVVGTLLTELVSGGMATMNVQKWDGSNWVFDHYVAVYDFLGFSNPSFYNTGTKVAATWHAQSARYILTGLPGTC